MNENVFYLGFNCVAQPWWKEIAPAPRAPSNWKDPEKIERYIHEKLASQEDEAPDDPVMGRVLTMTVLDSADTFVFSGPGEEGYEYIGHLLSEGPLTLYGFHIKRRLHQLAVTALLAKKTKRAWGLFLTSPVFQNEFNCQLIDPIRLLWPGDYDIYRIVSMLRLADLVNDTQLASEKLKELDGAIGEAEVVNYLAKALSLPQLTF